MKNMLTKHRRYCEMGWTCRSILIHRIFSGLSPGLSAFPVKVLTVYDIYILFEVRHSLCITDF